MTNLGDIRKQLADQFGADRHLRRIRHERPMLAARARLDDFERAEDDRGAVCLAEFVVMSVFLIQTLECTWRRERERKARIDSIGCEKSDQLKGKTAITYRRF
jgi:hypothetical protein